MNCMTRVKKLLKTITRLSLMKKLFLVIFILLSVDINAQYITIDKDGYTNIRKEPNTKSDIVETVKKYQVFYTVQDIPCSPVDYESNDYGDWLAITTDMDTMAGYIYKKNLYSVENLPNIAEEVWIGKDSIKIWNDDLNIEISISLQSYNEKNKLSDKKAYGIDGGIPSREIKEIKINNKGKTLTLPENKFKNFYDIVYIGAWLGFDGEIYIMLHGADGSAGYEVMLSVFGGEVLYSLPMEC